jgi:hypothetical protein
LKQSLLVFFIFFGLNFNLHANPNISSPIKVFKLRGNIELNLVGQLPKKLKEGDLLTPPFKIKASEKSFVILQMNDVDLVMLKNGELNIDEIKTPEKKITEQLFELIKGTIFLSQEPLKGESVRPEKIFKTKQASMGIRGTKFFLEVTDSTYLCVCEGKVQIDNGVNQLEITEKEDVYAQLMAPMKKSLANDMMIKMVKDGFKEMGIEVF